MDHTEAVLLSFLHFTLPGLTHAQTMVVEYTWIAILLVIVPLAFVAANLKRVPRGYQNVVESLIGALEGYIVTIVGTAGLKYFTLIASVFFFIAAANYLGLVPGCLAPTGALTTNAAWAIIVFVFYNFLGFQKHGFIGYIKHFFGPIWWMAPVVFVVEIISQFARPLSLSFRLFANLLAGETIIKLLFSVALGSFLFFVPSFWMLWESIITAPIQAFVFSLLTMVYIGGAIGSDEEH